MVKRKNADQEIIGWREWVVLPDLGITNIKAKVDTGARSSSLHAFDLHTLMVHGEEFVRFKVHPLQRDSRTTVESQAKVLEYRSVRSSSGKAAMRPVIVTTIRLLDQWWPIELTLANRDEMGFRMLLGREGIRGRFLVDSGKSFRGEKPARPVRLKKSKKKKKKKIRRSR